MKKEDICPSFYLSCLDFSKVDDTYSQWGACMFFTQEPISPTNNLTEILNYSLTVISELRQSGTQTEFSYLP